MSPVLPSCPHRAQCRFAPADTAAATALTTRRPPPRSSAAPVFTSRPACSGRPVLVSLCSPPARTAQCMCYCSVRLPGLPSATPSLPRIPDHHGPLMNRCPLRGPRARATQCLYRCAARVLGLHGVCASAQSACPDCPMPPLLPVVSTITPPSVPAGPVALVRNLGLPFPSPGSRLAGPYARLTRPRPPARPRPARCDSLMGSPWRGPFDLACPAG